MKTISVSKLCRLQTNRKQDLPGMLQTVSMSRVSQDQGHQTAQLPYHIIHFKREDINFHWHVINKILFQKECL